MTEIAAHSAELPTGVYLDDTDTPCDVIDALALAPFSSGREPWARSVRLSRVRRDATLLPPGATVLRTAVEDGRRSLLAAGDGWTLRAVRWRDRAAHVTITAVTDELARTVHGVAGPAGTVRDARRAVRAARRDRRGGHRAGGRAGGLLSVAGVYL